MRIAISVFLLCYLLPTYGQEASSFYPAGVYNSFPAFIKKESSYNEIVSLEGSRNPIINTFRVKDSRGKRIQGAFAVSDGKDIYIRTNAMIEYFTNQEFDKPNTTNKDYSKAYLQNDKYLYFECFFQSKGVSTWGVGTVYLSGIICDLAGANFTVIRTEDDINTFLESIKVTPKATELNSKSDRLNIEKTRDLIMPLFE